MIESERYNHQLDSDYSMHLHPLREYKLQARPHKISPKRPETHQDQQNQSNPYPSMDKSG